MANILYNLCVKIREYKDSNGNDKAVWENIGSIIESKDGNPFLMLKAHFNPAAIRRKDSSECILVSLFKPKDKNSGNNEYSATYEQPALYNPDSEVPF